MNRKEAAIIQIKTERLNKGKIMRKCHDCFVDEGQIHQYGCDMERCPFCGNQLISCGCIYKKLNIDCSPETKIYKQGVNNEQKENWIKILENKERIPYILYPNICGRCGEIWPDMFNVPKKEWEKYIPITKRNLILCKSCYGTIKKLIDEEKE